MAQSTKFDITEADFRLFTVLWNQKQGQRTPAIHFRMADWLEDGWRRNDRKLLLMAFRSSGKSTMVGLFAAWLLYRKPDLRILVLAADSALAAKMVRNVKRIIERHPLTARMKPKNPDQWASDRFTVRRNLELRDPSMIARGITANITGSRADIVICDDVEVPNTCDSAEKRQALRERLAEMQYVLADERGTQLYVGTPHSYYSIYAETPRAEIGEEDIFLPGFKRLSIPVLTENGQSAWPERFSPEALADIKRQSGPNKFASQMMLRPVNIAEGRLDPVLLRHYDAALDYAPELKTLYLNGVKMVAASAWWDPSFARHGGDASVLAVVFADGEGALYLHHLEYIRPASENPGESDLDEATRQCRIIAGLVRDFRLPSLSVETNGLGKFLPAILRNELARAHAPCRVIEAVSTRAKDLRILEAFDAPLAARLLHVNKTVLKTPFIAEMQEWRPGHAGLRDDGLDAAAGALAQQPVRLARLYGAGGQGWMNPSGTKLQAKTDFRL